MGIETHQKKKKKKAMKFLICVPKDQMAIHSGPISSNLGKLVLKYDHLNPFEFPCCYATTSNDQFFNFFSYVLIWVSIIPLFISMSNLI
jgi:hypothetical protein